MEIDGRLLIKVFEAMGIDDWKSIADTQMTITPPGTIEVRHYLRNEHGKFFKKDGTHEPAQQITTATVRWPDADEEG